MWAIEVVADTAQFCCGCEHLLYLLIQKGSDANSRIMSIICLVA